MSDARATNRRRPIALAALVVGALAVGIALDLGERLADLRGLIEDLGPAGPLLFVVIYAAAVVALVPASLITVAAGALFGAALGIAVVVAGASVGACLSFLVARRVARQAVRGWLGHRRAFVRIDELTARHGAPAVLIPRLVPILPFSLLNYAFGLTRVRFATYAIWTAIGIVPGTALYVLGGDVVSVGLSEGSVPAWQVVALALAALLLAGAGLLGRRWLRTHRQPGS